MALIVSAAVAGTASARRYAEEASVSPKLDGEYLYWLERTFSGRSDTEHEWVKRVDTRTGRVQTLFHTRARQVRGLAVGDGWVALTLSDSARDGPVVMTKAPGGPWVKRPFPVKWNRRDHSGEMPFVRAVSPHGDVVVAVDDDYPDGWTSGVGHPSLLRADNSVVELELPAINDEDAPGPRYSFAGGRLLAVGVWAVQFDLATGAKTVAWTGGLEDAVAFDDGTLFLSVLGAAGDRQWRALVRGSGELTDGQAVAWWEQKGFQPKGMLVNRCGNRILTATAIASDEYGFFDEFGNQLVYGSVVRLSLFAQDGRFERSIGTVRRGSFLLVGCSPTAAIVVAQGKRGDKIARVPF